MPQSTLTPPLNLPAKPWQISYAGWTAYTYAPVGGYWETVYYQYATNGGINWARVKVPRSSYPGGPPSGGITPQPALAGQLLDAVIGINGATGNDPALKGGVQSAVNSLVSLLPATIQRPIADVIGSTVGAQTSANSISQPQPTTGGGAILLIVGAAVAAYLLLR